MEEDSKLAWRIRRQPDGFVGRVTEGVGKAKSRGTRDVAFELPPP